MAPPEIGVTINVYTHLGLDGAKDEMIRMKGLEVVLITFPVILK